MKAWIWRWGPAILLMTLIFAASATPSSHLPKFGSFDIFAKKAGHMVGYALLAVSYFHILNNGRKTTQLQFIAAACLAMLYSTTDEIHQLFTPGRTSSIIDVGIDAIGSSIGLALWRWIRMRFLDPRKAAASIKQE
jgi:VanZ family protein